MVQTSMAIREPGCSASAARIHTDMLARGEAGCCDRGHRGPWIASWGHATVRGTLRFADLCGWVAGSWWGDFLQRRHAPRRDSLALRGFCEAGKAVRVHVRIRERNATP